MTKQEVKDEHKQMEGDPMVKIRLRSSADATARVSRMMAAVSQGDADRCQSDTLFRRFALRTRRRRRARSLSQKVRISIALKIRFIAEAEWNPRFTRTVLWLRSLYASVDVDQYDSTGVLQGRCRHHSVPRCSEDKQARQSDVRDSNMLKQGNDYSREREKALADGLEGCRVGLRMMEPADFITFIQTEQFGNLRTLVNSSTEMFFKPGTILFRSFGGDRICRWGCSPCISLDMEFHHLKVSGLLPARAQVAAGRHRDQLRVVRGRLAGSRREYRTSR